MWAPPAQHAGHPLLTLGHGAHGWAPPFAFWSWYDALIQHQIGVVSIHYDAVCIGRIGAAGFTHVLSTGLHPSGFDEPRDGTLKTLTAAIDLVSERRLTRRLAPSELVGVTAEKTQHVQIPPLEFAINHSPGRYDGIARIVSHAAPSMSSILSPRGGNKLGL